MHKRVWPTTFALRQRTFSRTGLSSEKPFYFMAQSVLFQTVQFKNGSAAGGPRFFRLQPR